MQRSRPQGLHSGTWTGGGRRRSRPLAAPLPTASLLVGLGWLVLGCLPTAGAATSAPEASPPVPAVAPATPTAQACPSRPLRICPTARLADAITLPAAIRAGVVSQKKIAWEATRGGQEAAKPQIRARLLGWPSRTRANNNELPADDHAFLLRVARDTWRGLDALRDRENGLPVNSVRLPSTPGATDAHVGDYTSSTDVGLYLAAVAAAHQLGFVSQPDAVARIRQVLDTVEGLEHYRGSLFNYYDTTVLDRTSTFVSFVDSSWLTAGLIAVRTSFPELHDRCTRMLAQQDYAVFYDAGTGLMSHGYYTPPTIRSPYHYGMLYTESRLGSLLAIGKGDVPECHWFAMLRTLPGDCDGQSQAPRGTTDKTVRGHRFSAGYYEWEGTRFVPSWGGSMFEALMPTLLLDELRYAPDSLGANARAHVLVQRRYATETLGYPVWGISPSATPSHDGYGEFGVRVLGALGYFAGAVTPHAAALALAVDAPAAIANLRALAQRYDIYGDYGFYDAVDPQSGTVAYKYLALDQAMLFLAVANHLSGQALPRRFVTDPIVQSVLPVIGAERFFE